MSSRIGHGAIRPHVEGLGGWSADDGHPSLGTAIEGELRTWGVSRRLAVAVLIVPIAGAGLAALAALWDPLFRLLTAEDRVFEWAQFVCWLVGAIASGGVAIRLFRDRRRLVALLWAGLALGLLLVAGEEIAWGQRLFGLETPAALERVNRQGEITVHNIRGVGTLFAAVFVAAGLYGGGSALWFRYLRPVRNDEPIEFVVPPLFLASLFFFVPVYKLARAALDAAGVPPLTDYAEYGEFCLAFGFAAFAVLSLRRRALTRDRISPHRDPVVPSRSG